MMEPVAGRRPLAASSRFGRQRLACRDRGAARAARAGARGRAGRAGRGAGGVEPPAGDCAAGGRAGAGGRLRRRRAPDREPDARPRAVAPAGLRRGDGGCAGRRGRRAGADVIRADADRARAGRWGTCCRRRAVGLVGIERRDRSRRPVAAAVGVPSRAAGRRAGRVRCGPAGAGRPRSRELDRTPAARAAGGWRRERGPERGPGSPGGGQRARRPRRDGQRRQQHRPLPRIGDRDHRRRGDRHPRGRRPRCGRPAVRLERRGAGHGRVLAAGRTDRAARPRARRRKISRVHAYTAGSSH